jgi:hypothetical protein
MSRRHAPATSGGGRGENYDRSYGGLFWFEAPAVHRRAYGSVEILAWLLDAKNIAPHVPVWDKSERADGTFSRSDFLFDTVSNTYTCPGRQNSAAVPPAIRPAADRRHKEHTRLYRASQSDCAGIRPQGQMLSLTAAPQGAEKRSRGSARGPQRPHQHTRMPPVTP